jgi:predicted nucleic acid-binding protein
LTDWLLDTNVLTELRRPKPDRRVIAFVQSQPLERLYVSTVTIAEIRYGIDRITDNAQRAESGDWLAQAVRPMFAQRILEVSEDVMLRWRLLVEAGRKTGHTFPQPDLEHFPFALAHGKCSTSLLWRATLSDQMIPFDRMLL